MADPAINSDSIMKEIDSALKDIYHDLDDVYVNGGINATYTQYKSIVRMAFIEGYKNGLKDSDAMKFLKE